MEKETGQFNYVEKFLPETRKMQNISIDILTLNSKSVKVLEEFMKLSIQHRTQLKKISFSLQFSSRKGFREIKMLTESFRWCKLRQKLEWIEMFFRFTFVFNLLSDLFTTCVTENAWNSFSCTICSIKGVTKFSHEFQFVIFHVSIAACATDREHMFKPAGGRERECKHQNIHNFPEKSLDRALIQLLYPLMLHSITIACSGVE